MGKEDDAWSRVTGKGVFPVEYAWSLTTPWRRLIFTPSRLLRLMRLKPTDNVLEIGCGPGYFSPTIARFLKRGTLTLFDYQDGMLDIAEARLKKRRLSNYVRQQGDAKALPFPGARFDAAFMVTVLGEVGDAGQAIREAFRVLKPGGRLSVTEQFGDPDFVSRRALKQLAQATGFALEARFGPAFFYTCNFTKPAAISRN